MSRQIKSVKRKRRIQIGSTKRILTFVAGGVLIICGLLGGFFACVLSKPGATLTPIFIMVRSAVNDYKCEKGKWPKNPRDIASYIKRDPNLVRYEPDYSLTYSFVEQLNTLLIRIRGKQGGKEFEVTETALGHCP